MITNLMLDLAPHRNLYLPACYGADSEPTYSLKDVADYAAVYEVNGAVECCSDNANRQRPPI